MSSLQRVRSLKYLGSYRQSGSPSNASHQRPLDRKTRLTTPRFWRSPMKTTWSPNLKSGFVFTSVSLKKPINVAFRMRFLRGPGKVVTEMERAAEAAPGSPAHLLADFGSGRAHLPKPR